MANLVSILIPAYNASRWLGESVTSALAQTWPRKEVVIVDDGSRDDTLAIARTFRQANVKVVTQPNGGAPSARNHALSLAQGDYIQWLDADDVLHPEKIARQMDHAGDGHRALTLLTSSWGKFFFRTAKTRFVADALWQPRLTPVDWILTRFNENVWMNPAVWLMSRRLVEATGPWDSRLARSGDDDGEYICRAATFSDGVQFVPQAQAYYRIGTVGSLNWNMETSEQYLDSLMLSLQLTIGHLLKLENSQRTRAAALRYLQAWSAYFYGMPHHHLDRLEAVGRELGGFIERPRAGWKYYPIEKTFGPRVAKTVIRNWRAGKLLARRQVDLCLHRMGI